MVKTLSLKGPPALVAHVKQSARLKRLSLRVSSLDGRVTLSVPQSASMQEARDFLQDRESWLRAALARQPQSVQVVAGVAVPVAGRALIIDASPGTPFGIGETRIGVRAGRPAGRQVETLLKHRARDLLQEACGRHGARLGRQASALALRDTRSRWGSCSSAGRLMFSWRLVMAPYSVLDYVAAHEVAHLREMNHGPRFWAQVARLCPDFDAHRQWLRCHGAALHRYRFEGDKQA